MPGILTQPLPHFLYRRSGQTTFIVFVAIFSLIFINAYKPFNSFEWIPYIRYRGSNAAYLLISTGLVAAGLLILVLSRIIMTIYTRRREMVYGVFMLWVGVETIVMASVYTLYAILSNDVTSDFLQLWKNTIVNTVLVLFIPYVIFIIYVSWREKDRQLRQMAERLENSDSPAASGLIPLYNDKGELQLSLKMENLILLESADNYVCVWYMNNDTVKKIMIRNTMKCMARDLDGSSIVRCHRSYMVNLDHVKVMRRQNTGITIELGIAGIPDIPISKTYCDSVTRWLMR